MRPKQHRMKLYLRILRLRKQAKKKSGTREQTCSRKKRLQKQEKKTQRTQTKHRMKLKLPEQTVKLMQKFPQTKPALKQNRKKALKKRMQRINLKKKVMKKIGTVGI